MSQTKIEYVGRTWNPMTGCTPISEGCEHCYAKRMARRLRGRAGYPADDPFRVTIHKDRLMEPTKWKKPQRVLVCSMGDLFHEDVPREFVFRIFQIIQKCPQHIFLLLTKRSRRMHDVFWDMNSEYASEVFGFDFERGEPYFPNVYPGITAENQARADERFYHLLQIPTDIKWASIEPMLSSVNLNRWLYDDPQFGDPGLKGVVVGAETGPGARPMHPDWVRSVRDDCQAAGVPFFFKGWGEWVPGEPVMRAGHYSGFYRYQNEGWPHWTEQKYRGVVETLEDGTKFAKVGKKAAGRLLDGREWDEVPGVSR